MSAARRGGDISIYDTRAQHWWDFSDPIFLPLHAMVPAREAYLERHGIDVRDKRVLDVGCGGGYVSALLRRRGAHVVGMDLAASAVAAARGHIGGGAWLCAEAERLPFRDGSFDVVVNTDVLVHLTDPRPCLAEVARVLAPDGLLWFSTINDSWLARFVLITLGERLLRFVHRGTHDARTFLSPPVLGRLLDDVGLTLLASEGVGPVRVDRRGQLVMGRLPTRAVMWQGHAGRRSPLVSGTDREGSTGPVR